jgi:hypothetical protein
VSKRHLRRPITALALVISAVLAIAVAGARMSNGNGTSLAVQGGEPESTPALARHLATITPAPPGSSNGQEGDRSSADEEFLARAAPGTDIAAPVLKQSTQDWSLAIGRGNEGDAHWQPLGPTWGKNLPNPFRDRSVYTAGTQDFSGRIADVAIDVRT